MKEHDTKILPVLNVILDPESNNFGKPLQIE